MPNFIALYRGINVGGRNPVKMEALRAMHERLGHREVKSYIQSGNLVFGAKGSAATVARKTVAAFAEEFGFAAKLMLIDATHWGEIVKSNPYTKQAAGDPKSVHAAICEGAPDAQGLKALLAKTAGREVFTIREEILYLHSPDGFGTSKFAAGMERAAGVAMTARNWRTIAALSELAGTLNGD